MKTHAKLLCLLLAVALALSAAACGKKDTSDPSPRTLTDPSGVEITVPESIDTLAVLAPSLVEMVTALGHGDGIVACDTTSVGLEGVKDDAVVLDLTNPDMEGVCVACVPNAESISGIESDIAFVASLLGEEEKGRELVDGMRAEVDRIAAIGKTVTERKSVYFEISAAPYLYSFGQGVFLHEMLELIGADNILAGETGWLGVTEETVVAADPDVILTNVNYIDDPVGEILSRPGWDAVTAVREGAVYAVDNMASSLPNQNIVKALREMAEAVYPELYRE